MTPNEIAAWAMAAHERGAGEDEVLVMADAIEEAGYKALASYMRNHARSGEHDFREHACVALRNAASSLRQQLQWPDRNHIT